MTTYRSSGVDLDAADEMVGSIAGAVTATWGDDVVGSFGGFAAGIGLPPGYTAPVLMMSTDGVGTKAEIARQTDRLDGLGWDLVAMCVDDLVATGARPIAMTDYLAVGRLDVARVDRIVRSIAAACTAAGVALLGGETAEHPGVMDPDAFDLAGAALGVVERGREIDGRAISPGDVVLGLVSPNVRSNGFSLVRKIVPALELGDELPGTGQVAADILLEPSVLYTPAVLDVIDHILVHGMAHVTGGGIAGNLSRVLPAGCDAVITTDAWVPPAVFAAIQQLGNVPGRDMFRTFNMGIGFVLVVAPDDVADAARRLDEHRVEATIIGGIEQGTGGVRFG